jgi:MFS family permease
MLQREAGSFAALSILNFRILFVGALASFTAFFTATVIQGVVAFELTGTNTAVGGVVFGQGLGMLLCGPLGGAYADRLPKRRVVVIGQVVSATCYGTIGYLYATRQLEVFHLVANAFVVGCVFGFIGPARQALAADLVPVNMVGNAMALNVVSNTMSRVAGPFVAAVLLAYERAGPAAAYATTSLLYFTSAVLLFFLPSSIVREDVRETHVVADLVQGLRYAWHHPRLRNLLIFFVGVMLIGFPQVTLLPGLLENELGHPAEDFTRFALCSAVGALAASLTVARYADSPRATKIYGWLAMSFGVGLVMLSLMPSYPLALATMLVIGASSGGFQALNGAVIARETEPVFLGRMMSLTLLAFAGFSVTALPLGFLADHFGERPVLAGMGLGVVVLAFWMAAAVLRDEAR